jgi:hypothetical protein
MVVSWALLLVENLDYLLVEKKVGLKGYYLVAEMAAWLVEKLDVYSGVRLVEKLVAALDN